MLSSEKIRKPGERLTKGQNCLSFDCGTSNLAYCLLENMQSIDNEFEPQQEFSIRLWENFSLNAGTTADAVFSLRRELDSRQWMLHVDNVIIEAQVCSNPIMKVISHAIQMYFSCRGRSNPNSTPIPVHFISPKSKFKVVSVPEPNMAKGHAKNKTVAILMAKKILSNPENKYALDYLLSHKKKDDLSDCLLQGIYFFRLLRQKNRASRRILDHIKNEIKNEISIFEDGTSEIHKGPKKDEREETNKRESAIFYNFSSNDVVIGTRFRKPIVDENEEIKDENKKSDTH